MCHLDSESLTVPGLCSGVQVIIEKHASNVKVRTFCALPGKVEAEILSSVIKAF